MRVASTILCVLKTQVHIARVESLKSTIGFDCSFAVSSAGRIGGLGIFWNNQTRVEMIITESGEEPWRLTCIYGEAQMGERHKTWDMIISIMAMSQLLW